VRKEVTPINLNPKKGDEKMGVVERLHRTRQIKKLTKRLGKTSDYLERLKIEAELEGLRWKSEDSGEKGTH